MKKLKELMEGTVVSSDYKLSKNGRKYKAHRKMIEDTNPYSVDVDEATDKVVKDKSGKVTSWMHTGDWKKATKKDPAGKVTNLSDKARRKTASMANEAKDPREYDYEGDMAKSQLRSIIANAKQVHDMLKDDTNMAEWVQSKITLAADYISTVADYMQSEVKEDIEQVDEVSKETVSGYNKKAMAYIKNYKYSNNPPSVRRKLENRFSGVIRADERLKGTKPTSEEVKLDERIVMGPDGKPVPRKVSDDSGYVRSPEEEKAHQQAVRDQEETLRARDAKIDAENEAMRKKGRTRGFKLEEARGRPAGAATLAKRAAAASKPKEDDDESEQYDKDSGVEADQHIHVQLKKAVDSTEKPFEISFRNNKKHKVSSAVAKDILTATEKLKPEHRKQVHDQIHQSYDNLMGVHKMIKSV